jgi:hypothetical protein
VLAGVRDSFEKARFSEVGYLRPFKRNLLIGTVAFGLTLYEVTEHVDVTYRWDRQIRYLRATPSPTKRRSACVHDGYAGCAHPRGQLLLTEAETVA